MTMAHAQYVLLLESATSHEAHTNNELDNIGNGIEEDDKNVYMRRSKLRNLLKRCDNSNTSMQDAELSQEKLFQYRDSDKVTSLPTSDFIRGRTSEHSNERHLYQGEKTLAPKVLISEPAFENNLLDHGQTPCSKFNFQGLTNETLPELLQPGCKIDNPDSGIEKTPVLPNHSHFNFSHSPEPTVSIPLSTYFCLLSTHRYRLNPCAPRDTGPAYCRCHSWPGVAHHRAPTNSPAGFDPQEPGSTIGQCDDKRDKRVLSEAGFPKYELKTLIEGRVYDENAYKPQKKLPHVPPSPLSQSEPVERHRTNSKLFSCSALSSKGPAEDLFNKGPENFSIPIPSNSSASSFQVNTFHLPSPSLVSKSSFDQLTRELLRAKEMKKNLEEENENLRQVQKDLMQHSQELSQLLSVKSSLEHKIIEQEFEIRCLNQNVQKLQRKLNVKKRINTL